MDDHARTPSRPAVQPTSRPGAWSRRALALFLCLAALSTARASPQRPDFLSIDGSRYPVLSDPLKHFISEREAQEIRIRSGYIVSTCERGYIGSLDLEDGRLSLASLTGCYGEALPGVEAPDVSSFSGTIRVATGPRLSFSENRAHYASEAEVELVDGKLIAIDQVFVDERFPDGFDSFPLGHEGVELLLPKEMEPVESGVWKSDRWTVRVTAKKPRFGGNTLVVRQRLRYRRVRAICAASIQRRHARFGVIWAGETQLRVKVEGPHSHEVFTAMSSRVSCDCVGC